MGFDRNWILENGVDRKEEELEIVMDADDAVSVTDVVKDNRR